jgi:hypothetical protein
VYARRQKLSEEAIAYATAVRVDAMTAEVAALRNTWKGQCWLDGVEHTWRLS